MSVLDAVAPAQRFNPELFEQAYRVVHDQIAREKRAIVPAGAADPNAQGGGAPAPAPGGPAAMADPAAAGPPPGAAQGGDMVGQVVQQVMQQMQMQGGGPMGAGGPAGMLGKGGKKAEQQMIDTKLWQILYVLCQLAETMGVQIPPSIVVGPPPDPMAMQAVQQDHQSFQAGAPAGADPAAAGGAAPQGQAPPGVPPIQPMDAAQGPIGKQAHANLLDLGHGISLADLDSMRSGARRTQSLVERTRAALGYVN
jgi:hypothetical protein